MVDKSQAVVGSSTVIRHIRNTSIDVDVGHLKAVGNPNEVGSGGFIDSFYALCAAEISKIPICEYSLTCCA
jgi:hypothetical protein